MFFRAENHFGIPEWVSILESSFENGQGVFNRDVQFGWDSLELLCIYGHNAVHAAAHTSAGGRECVFDNDGNPIGIINHNG